MAILENISDLVRASYKVLSGGLKSAQRVLIVGSDGKEAIVKGGGVGVIIKPDQSKNTLREIVQVIGTTPEEIILPADIYEFKIFHLHKTALVHYGDEDVDTDYSTVAATDVIELDGDDDLTLYMVSDTIDTKIFIKYMELV